VNKPFINEMDMLRLRRSLLMCRLAANSTALVNKQHPGYSTKLQTLDELLQQLLGEPDRKIALFSEWTSMLDLIEPLVKKHNADFVRLDGDVPQRARAALVQRFQTEPQCRLFLTTNAGSTGLNLQAADTVINVDLPWNPAVLEQRIARAHRMGQTNPVQVYILVTEGTIEESLLATLAAKQDLALAALDSESDVDQVLMTRSSEALKQRLERLLGAKPAIDRRPSSHAASHPGGRSGRQCGSNGRDSNGRDSGVRDCCRVRRCAGGIDLGRGGFRGGSGWLGGRQRGVFGRGAAERLGKRRCCWHWCC
jgi:superfamily II DNA/RNA helicase